MYRVRGFQQIPVLNGAVRFGIRTRVPELTRSNVLTVFVSNAQTIGPLTNIAALNAAKSTTRSRVVHDVRVRIFSNINSPTAKVTSARGISVRTSVANRTLNKFRPNAASAYSAGKSPKVRARRKTKTARTSAATKEGNRQAKSQERVS